jgi:hypothetical protein
MTRWVINSRPSLLPKKRGPEKIMSHSEKKTHVRRLAGIKTAVDGRIRANRIRGKEILASSIRLNGF